MRHASRRPSSWHALSREQKQARLADLRHRQQQQVLAEGRLLDGIRPGR